jgi:hypothetical protein
MHQDRAWSFVAHVVMEILTDSVEHLWSAHFTGQTSPHVIFEKAVMFLEAL